MEYEDDQGPICNDENQISTLMCCYRMTSIFKNVLAVHFLVLLKENEQDLRGTRSSLFSMLQSYARKEKLHLCHNIAN